MWELTAHSKNQLFIIYFHHNCNWLIEHPLRTRPFFKSPNGINFNSFPYLFHLLPQTTTETGFRGILFGNELKLKYKLQSGLTGSTLNPLHHHLKVCDQSQVACIMNQKSRWLSRGTSYRFLFLISFSPAFDSPLRSHDQQRLCSDGGGRARIKMAVVCHVGSNL